MSKPFEVLIVDDHPTLSYGTKMILEEIEHVIVVGIASTAESCLSLLSEKEPNLILMDYNLPDLNGSELTKKIKLSYPAIHIVIFSGADLNYMYNQMLDLDISGMLGKNANADQLKNMVRSIKEGQTVIPIGLFKQLRMSEIEEPTGELLTEQESRIMTLVIEGYTQERIADTIFTSKRSVDNYLKKIYEKLGASGRMQAAQIFIETKKMGRDIVG
jgi:two-component system competent response regulator ComA